MIGWRLASPFDAKKIPSRANCVPWPSGRFRSSRVVSIRLCFNSDRAVSIVFAVVLKCPTSSYVMPRTSTTIGSFSTISTCILKTLSFKRSKRHFIFFCASETKPLPHIKKSQNIAFNCGYQKGERVRE